VLRDQPPTTWWHGTRATRSPQLQMVDNLLDLFPREPHRLAQRVVEAVAHVPVDDVPHEQVQKEEDAEQHDNHLDARCREPGRFDRRHRRRALSGRAAAGRAVVTASSGRSRLSVPQHCAARSAEIGGARVHRPAFTAKNGSAVGHNAFFAGSKCRTTAASLLSGRASGRRSGKSLAVASRRPRWWRASASWLAVRRCMRSTPNSTKRVRACPVARLRVLHGYLRPRRPPTHRCAGFVNSKGARWPLRSDGAVLRRILTAHGADIPVAAGSASGSGSSRGIGSAGKRSVDSKRRGRGHATAAARPSTAVGAEDAAQNSRVPSQMRARPSHCMGDDDDDFAQPSSTPVLTSNAARGVPAAGEPSSGVPSVLRDLALGPSAAASEMEEHLQPARYPPNEGPSALLNQAPAPSAAANVAEERLESAARQLDLAPPSPAVASEMEERLEPAAPHPPCDVPSVVLDQALAPSVAASVAEERLQPAVLHPPCDVPSALLDQAPAPSAAASVAEERLQPAACHSQAGEAPSPPAHGSGRGSFTAHAVAAPPLASTGAAAPSPEPSQPLASTGAAAPSPEPLQPARSGGGGEAAFRITLWGSQSRDAVLERSTRCSPECSVRSTADESASSQQDSPISRARRARRGLEQEAVDPQVAPLATPPRASQSAEQRASQQQPAHQAAQAAQPPTAARPPLAFRSPLVQLWAVSGAALADAPESRAERPRIGPTSSSALPAALAARPSAAGPSAVAVSPILSGSSFEAPARVQPRARSSRGRGNGKGRGPAASGRGRGQPKPTRRDRAPTSQASEIPQEGSRCQVCSLPWHRSGSHQACSLPCGHLFGRSCIEAELHRRASG